MNPWRNYSLISNSWNKGSGESLSQKVMGKVRPDEPLKNKIEFAQRKLQSQITKLEGINIKLQRKHDSIFEKIVNAQKSHNNGYAKAYALELGQVSIRAWPGKKDEKYGKRCQTINGASTTSTKHSIRTWRCCSYSQSSNVINQGIKLLIKWCNARGKCINARPLPNTR
jgi:hypothetical protein